MTVNGAAFIALVSCKRMMKQLQMLTSNLAMSDFLTGLMYILDASRYGADSLHALPIVTCKIRLHALVSLHYVTYFTVVVMTLDRVMGLYLHMRYQRLVSRGRLVFAVVCIWLLAVGVTVVSWEGLGQFGKYEHCSTI
jgi:hypothetical protein